MNIVREAESFDRTSPYTGLVTNQNAAGGRTSSPLGTDGEWLEFDIQQNTASTMTVVAYVERGQVADTNVVARLKVNNVNYDVQVPQTAGIFPITFSNVAFLNGVNQLRISGLSGQSFRLDKFEYDSSSQPSPTGVIALLTSSPAEIGNTANGTCTFNANYRVKAFKDGAEIAEIIPTNSFGSNGGWTFTPTVIGSYVFKLVFGTTVLDTTPALSVIAVTPTNTPNAPTVTAQIGKVLVNSGTGIVHIFREEIEVGTQASTGAFNYVPTAAGTYTFKLVTATGTSTASSEVVVTTETHFVIITKLCPDTSTSLQLGTGATAAEIINWQTAAIYENTAAGVTTKRADVTFLCVGGVYPKYFGRDPARPTESLSNAYDFTNAL